ncbi:MAG: alpha/beta fold hydrolase [Candidatus Eremiobacteraeota bacterium]|nr:alpha/beta fold hydrolase [Candidatus Eremiobacteraeota bacterium]
MIATRWFAPAAGVVCGARLSGERGDPLVFVHGVGSSAAIWDPQLRAFSATHRCAAIELRGNGAGEDSPPESITRDGFVQDVLAVADALGFSTFHFVGCSLGGVVGFELWKHAPQRLRSLVFVGSFAAYPDGTRYAATIVDAVRDFGSMTEFARARAPRVVPPGAPRQRLDETIEQMARKSVRSYVASTRATWTGDYRALLPSIAVPVLVVAGELDPVAPPVRSEEIAAAIPGARLVVVPGAGHVTNADAPAAFNSVLGEFFEGASG